MRIEKEYKKKGFFWLPEHEDKQVSGILTVSDGGHIELELIGDFTETIGASWGQLDSFKRIIGYIENDGYVTLEDCFYSFRTVFGVPRPTLVIQKLFSGYAWGINKEISFSTFSFAVDCLEEWLDMTGINIEHGSDFSSIKASCNPLENIDFILNNGMILRIYFTYYFTGFPVVKEAKITQRAYFKLESQVLQNIDNFIETAFKIVNFLCFVADAVASIKDVTATHPEIEESRLNNTEFRLKKISIYYKSTPYSEQAPKRSWHDMLFGFERIKDHAEQVFNNWLDAYNTISPTLNLYFSTKIGGQKYIEGRFLALAQALETFHRRTYHKTLMPPEDFESLVSTLVAVCPEEHSEWLTGRLKYGNEVNLRKRLKMIIEPFKYYIGSEKDRTKFILKIVDTRNYLTHYDKKLEESAAQQVELWEIFQKMEAILELHFLQILGFSKDEIDSIVKRPHSPLGRKLHIRKPKPTTIAQT